MLRSLSLLLAVIVVACGGGGTPAAAPGASGAAGGTTASTAPAAAGATGAPSQAAESGPSFADILRTGKLASYRVSYKMTTTGGGQDTGALEQTWYFKPPNTRLDFTMDDGYGSTSKISMFYLSTGSFFCTVAPEGSTCLKVAADGAAAQNLGFEIQSTFQEDPGAFSATSREQRTIAGQQAHCYVIAGTPLSGFTSGTFCYTQTGVPLLSEWAAGGSSFKMEATGFSADVSDNDFKLPAEPVSY